MRYFYLLVLGLLLSGCGPSSEKVFNTRCLTYAQSAPDNFNTEHSEACECMYAEMSKTMDKTEIDFIMTALELAEKKDKPSQETAIEMFKSPQWDKLKSHFRVVDDVCSLG